VPSDIFSGGLIFLIILQDRSITISDLSVSFSGTCAEGAKKELSPNGVRVPLADPVA
jgi:hypothetical protein